MDTGYGSDWGKVLHRSETPATNGRLPGEGNQVIMSGGLFQKGREGDIWTGGMR